MKNQLYDDMESTAENELAAILNDSQLESNVDIDSLLNDKAKKNQLTKTNVKNLIKNVLTNEDVATMLRQTLGDDKDANCLYEPKLTRAKIKEMLKNYPLSNDQWSPYQQQSIISECRLLIEKEFPDDSEDEEYHPDKILEDDDEDDDDDEAKLSEISTPSKEKCITENDVGISESTSMVDLNDKETIGMRTRSKLSLNDTPLETIEQAFIPPDITEDMYDSACENDEWMEFLSEFTKPLEFVQNDDGEDDPEYNVLCDDELTNVDKEEFRIDRSVKVSRKEYNDLMTELYEFTESYMEFNGGVTLDTDSATCPENGPNKNMIKHKNSSQSISVDQSAPIEQSIIVDQSISVDQSIPTNQFIPIYQYIPINESIPIYQSNPVSSSTCFDWNSNTSNPTNEAQMTELTSCSTQSRVSLHKNLNKYLRKSNHILRIPVKNIELDELQSGIANDQIFEKTMRIPRNSTTINQSRGMLPKQLILLKQQLTQHVQLITQCCLLCTMTNKYKYQIQKLQNMLQVVESFCQNKKYAPINIRPAIKFIEEWSDVKTNLKNYSSGDYVLLPSYVKEFMLFYNEPVFIYPQLLPSKTLQLEPTSCPMNESEEMVLVLKIDHLYKQLKGHPQTRAKFRNNCLSDLMPLIMKIIQKRWFSHRKLRVLRQYISNRRNTLQKSVLKNYLRYGKIENTIHLVEIGALLTGRCLYDYDIHKFPSSWKPFVKRMSITQQTENC